MTLDDLTSGFNIGTNYSLSFGFNEMVGFTEQEVRQMLSYYSQQYDFNHSVDELIEIMKPYYDNYCFANEAYGNTTMYNSNKEFAHDASVIQTLVSQGFVTGELKEGFPAERIADTVNANAHIAHTQLHKVCVVYRRVEMVAC